ncbi:tetratricopeptide repeat protein [bacterium]|nr:tetratricopeptide repeat protein [bacterium]
MTAELRVLKELFLAAIEVAPAGRARWLDESCGPGQRELLEKMLLAHEADRDLFDFVRPAMGHWTSSPAASEAPGAAIGPYKLLRQLGEGGTATVWLAEQAEPVPRQVALKVLHTALLSRQILVRFRAELRVLALMDHPNIARVLDAGVTESGRSYIAMEVIDGVPITRFCDEAGHSLRDRVAVFLQVCHAVRHAHIKGVIHRDLKPSNVLVGRREGRPSVKVIDFSIAKVTDRSWTGASPVTAVGTVVGTLAYMSPEQAEAGRADIDTRSDVYLLGVLLYELITGTPPLTEDRVKAPLLDVLRAVREEDPPPPSARLAAAEELPGDTERRGTEPAKLVRMVRGDLDCIVMKALEKDLTRRYQSAGDLAADLERYLADEPILARPPSVTYRLGKLVRRHKGRLAVAAGLTLAALIATAVVGWTLRDRAARQADADRKRNERASRVSARVESALAETNQLVRQEKWQEALAAARLAQLTVVEEETDAATREKAAVAVRELVFVGELDRTRLAVSVWKDDGFDYAGADLAYAGAFRAFGIDVESLPPAEVASRLLRHGRIGPFVSVALDQWCDTRRRATGADESAWRPLVDLANRLDPDPLRVRLRASWGQKATPARLEELRGLVETLGTTRQNPNTLTLLAASLRGPGLVDLQERVLRLAQEQYPDDFWVNLDLANALHRQKKLTDEAQFVRAAVALRPESTAALNNLGLCLLDLAKPDEAVVPLRKAVTLDPSFALGHKNLARGLEALGDLAGAEASLRRAVDSHPKDVPGLDRLARVLSRQGKREEAIAIVRKSIEIDPSNSGSHSNLGTLLTQQGNVDEAVASYRKAAELDPKNYRALTNLGNTLAKQGKLTDAVTPYQKAIEVEPNSADAHHGLGCVLVKQGKLDEAVANWRKAVEFDPKLADAHKNLGQAMLIRGDFGRAAESFRKAVDLAPKDAAVFNNLAVALDRQGKRDEAIACLRRAVVLAPTVPRSHNNLGALLAEQGKLDEAIECFSKALELNPKDVRARQQLGTTLTRRGKWDEGMGRLREAVKLEPNNHEALVSLAQALLRAEKPPHASPKEALGLARTAVKLRATAGTVETLAEAAARCEQWREALEARQRLAELRVPVTEDKFHLAVAHWRAGNREEARKWHAEATREFAQVATPSPTQTELRTRADALLTEQPGRPRPPDEPSGITGWECCPNDLSTTAPAIEGREQ